ncbi:26972_t:CDS:2 [Gigaspora margarita]|uniref:26972_t:CDS:1 n=1 Tax=Gigaspora margarita TaxID=4874 RepID=A0ABN7UY25_GIGMA|nr:26972_t:CDS:2 [Gigaspora margarita]
MMQIFIFDENINRRGKVLKAARQQKSKIQPVEGIIPLQAIKRKMGPLQDVVKAQTDFVDRMKEISLILTIESMMSSHVGIKTNQFTILEVFFTEPEELSQNANQITQIKKPSQNTDQNIQIKTEGIRTQQMEVDIQHVTDLETEENLEKGKENTQKMDTEEISKKKGTNETSEKLSYNNNRSKKYSI